MEHPAASRHSAQHVNNFDLIRLFAAIMVLHGHSFPISGSGAPPVFYGHAVSTIGITIFFAISGYLISQAIDRDRNPLHYFWNRALRILPGLTVATLGMILLGLAVTSLSPGEYLAEPQVLSFLLNNAVMQVRYYLPGVFQENPYPGAINGSWWSLPVEATMYVAFYVFLLLGRWGLLLAIACQLGMTWIMSRGVDPVVWETPMSQVAPASIYFLYGSIMWCFRDWVRPSWPLGILLLVVVAPLTGTQLGVWLIPAVITYGTISIGLAPSPWPRYRETLGDLSYGTYLYAFGIQQLVVYLLGSMATPSVVTMVSAPICLGLAFASWRLVERPALSLKLRPARAPVPQATTLAPLP